MASSLAMDRTSSSRDGSLASGTTPPTPSSALSPNHASPRTPRQIPSMPLSRSPVSPGTVHRTVQTNSARREAPRSPFASTSRASPSSLPTLIASSEALSRHRASWAQEYSPSGPSSHPASGPSSSTGLSGPSQPYSFPSRKSDSIPVPISSSSCDHGSSHSGPSSPNRAGRASMSDLPLNTAQHRLSFSAASRPRRASPLMHEIQPPARRLSAHQVMLLTPFGGSMSLPTARTSLGGGAAGGMRRESSSMGEGVGRRSSTISAYPATGGMTNRENSSVSLGQAVKGEGPSRRTDSVGGLSLNTAHPPRTRHSFASSVPLAGPSPLAISQPLTTIASNSDHSSSNPSSALPSRDASHDPAYEVGSVGEHDVDEGDAAAVDQLELVALSVSGTVEMTRSNSLPVLTLRELEAMKEKDGELGIRRGGDWAWVSRDAEDDDATSAAEPDGVDGMADDTRTPNLDTPSSARSSTNSLDATITPPVHSSFAPVTFNDPFSPGPSTRSSSFRAAEASGSSSAAGSGTFRRTEETSRFANYRPVATAEGYLYASGISEARRSSETPATSSMARGGAAGRIGKHAAERGVDARRPSAPALGTRVGVDASSSSATAASLLAQQHKFPVAQIKGLESPRGTPLSSPIRPRITRYKTSPARYSGLGLSIVVQSQTPAAGGGGGANAGGTESQVASGVRRSSELSAGSSPSGTASNGTTPRTLQGFALSTVERRERRHARLRGRATGDTTATDADADADMEAATTRQEAGADMSPISPVSPIFGAGSGSVSSRVSRGSRPAGSRLGSWTAVGVVDGLEAETYRLPPDVERRLSDRTGSVSSVSSRGSVSGLPIDTRASFSSAGPGLRRESRAASAASVASATARNVVLLESTRGMTLSEFGVPRGSAPLDPPSGTTAYGLDPSKAKGLKGKYDSLDSAFPRSRTRSSIVTHPLYGAAPDIADSSSLSAPAPAPGAAASPAALALEQSRFDTFPRRSSLAVLTQLESLGGGLVGLWTRRSGSGSGTGRSASAAGSRKGSVVDVLRYGDDEVGSNGRAGRQGREREQERGEAEEGSRGGRAGEGEDGEGAADKREGAGREWYHRRGSWAEGWQSGR